MKIEPSQAGTYTFSYSVKELEIAWADYERALCSFPVAFRWVIRAGFQEDDDAMRTIEYIVQDLIKAGSVSAYINEVNGRIQSFETKEPISTIPKS